MTNVPQSAAAWALEQLGCPYSQARRTQEGVFDCSSLVARAYSAQGKRWRHGGSVPVSMYEVYDDDFELLWPEDYADIGMCFGGSSVIRAHPECFRSVETDAASLTDVDTPQALEVLRGRR